MSEIPNQLRHYTKLVYPAAAHTDRDTDVKKKLEDVLTHLSICVTPGEKCPVKTDIVRSFTKIKTANYYKILEYVRNEDLTQWEIQRNFAVWCATSGCGVAMTHLLSNMFTNNPHLSYLTEKQKEAYNNRFNLPNPMIGFMFTTR